MVDNRRPARGSRPPGRTGPGRTPASGRGGRRPAAAAAAADRRPAARPRPTGRLAILVVVLAVLAVSYASSLRAFLEQREDINELQSQIAERQRNIDELAREKRRWQDPAYVVQEARKRLGYVMPGETAYVALDEHGDPIEAQAALGDPAAIDPPEPEAWWSDAWGSVELAGDPPAEEPPPLTRIDGSEEDQQ